MTLKEQIAIDGKAVFLNTDEFAEEITYRYPDTTEITIPAIIIRERLNMNDENVGRSLKKQAELYIAKEDIASIDKQNDKIILNDTDGTSRTARIQETLSDDEEMWHVIVGW